MVVRWLLCIVTVLALAGQSVAAWAAAGVIGEATCCCPQPDTCKCHDHDGSPQSELRRCSGDAELVAPAPLTALPPADPAAACEVAAVRVALPAPAPLPARRSDPPEKPPF